MKGFLNFFSKGFQQLNPKKFFQMAAVISSAAALSVAGFFHFMDPDADISNLKNKMYQPTLIYDQNDKLASKVTANKIETIPISQVPEHVKNAVVAIEDHRFYEHNGVDYQGIFRAAVSNVKAGRVVQGGSTLTQQLTKNALLNSDRTYKRKFKEYFLAKEVEKKFSKDEILEMYLNQIYFGHGAWGIKRASQIYFGKEVKQLTAAEGALLAGIVKAPSQMDPFVNKDRAIERRNIVLSEMVKYKFISKEVFNEAKDQELALNTDNKEDPLKGKYPHFVDAVFEEAVKKYKLDQDKLLTGGYRIYTTLDQDMQKAAEEVYQNDSLFPEGSNGKLVQSGAVLIDPKTGGINALVGGRGEHTFRGYNRATQLKTQPGSTMKPLAVYTPALENGYNLSDELKDEKMNFGNYEPSNYNDEYKGEVPMYEALMKSLNVPAVWLLNEIGISKGMESVKKFGIPLTEEDRRLGLALGAHTNGVSPVEMAEAYSAFPNNGERIDSHSIIKIVDAEGNEIAKWKEVKTKVTEKAIANKMTSMLMGVVEQGTGQAAAVDGWEIAGKTGSTQVPIDGIDGVKDQWFVGYSPVLAGAVWLGYDKTDENHYLTTTSSEGAAPLFKELMSKALQHKQHESFDVKSIETYMKEERERAREQFWKDQKQRLKDNWKKWTEPFSQDKKDEEQPIESQDTNSVPQDQNESNEMPAEPEAQQQEQNTEETTEIPKNDAPSNPGTQGESGGAENETPAPPVTPENPPPGDSNPDKPEPDKPEPEDPEPEDPEPDTPDKPEPEDPGNPDEPKPEEPQAKKQAVKETKVKEQKTERKDEIN
ncbi:penicillin-binding protein 2A [Peribacillus deserti]|uniref:Penicillin-binding protein 2A n=1 Tax=Peribacillus deserti TaxID=673318 RepID=A0ABS2QN46_9BACI|nr:penicillin-binding protein 1A [Peribacillus deserti]MBM7694144.1 penicillin-binding protein 2A [Peribacillus deserti]